MPSVTYLCDRVLFLYKGVVEELLPVVQISEAKSEYTQKLLYSILDIKSVNFNRINQPINLQILIRYFIDFHDNLVRDFVDNTDILVVFSLCIKVDGSDYLICINMASAVLKSFYISLLYVLQY